MTISHLHSSQVEKGCPLFIHERPRVTLSLLLLMLLFSHRTPEHGYTGSGGTRGNIAPTSSSVGMWDRPRHRPTIDALRMTSRGIVWLNVVFVVKF